MEQLSYFVQKIYNLVWGIPLLLLLLGTGAYLTVLLKGMQFRYLGYAIKQVFAKQRENSEGDISHFDALMTSLAGAIGTGTIVGVATGITVGGLGSLFWMWVMALLGMATKYAESLLAVKFREVDAKGEMIGGPMEYIEKGLGWKWMAAVFAIFGAIAAIGTGNLAQVNSISAAVSGMWDIDPWITGLITAVMTALVIVGGVKSIGHVAGILVPLMAIFYICGGLIIIGLNIERVPEAFATIFRSAFEGQAAVGGFVGSTVMMALQVGVARSIFSNEAGLGIPTMAAAAARTDSPGRQAMITMTGALLSTVIICTITGLVLAVTDSVGSVTETGSLLTGVALAMKAFGTIPGGHYVVSIGLILFAFSTVIAWAYYGEKCCEYLFGVRSVIFYRLIYSLLVIPGAALHIQVVWNFADIFNGLMAIPNLIALILLSKVIVTETNAFLKTVAEDRALELRERA